MKKRGYKNRVLRFLPIIILITLASFLLIQSQFQPTGQVISETSTLATKTTSYIYANGLVSSYDSDGNEKFYINDNLGSGSVVLDENGNKISEDSYFAFGVEKTASEEAKFKYTGKELDDSGLYYYGARYYDPASGRFTSPDPISGSIENPQSLNKYSYVLNNPNKFVDPTGKQEAAIKTVVATPTSPEVRAAEKIIERYTKKKLAEEAAKKVATRFIPFIGSVLVAFDFVFSPGELLVGEEEQLAKERERTHTLTYDGEQFSISIDNEEESKNEYFYAVIPEKQVGVCRAEGCWFTPFRDLKMPGGYSTIELYYHVSGGTQKGEKPLILEAYTNKEDAEMEAERIYGEKVLIKFRKTLEFTRSGPKVYVWPVTYGSEVSQEPRP
ncbi:RHS repeat-associated core domain-containing protein [Candidatus Pacearchaeota archaeon]|nr:RHS repeat-associated core domain-containing protein [Candidatus Pacearchaeota archaeon]